MKIDFLEMINFRNMAAQKIFFEGKRFIVLIGDNGSGKTTILEAITRAFVPVLRTVNSEAMKANDLSNNDVRLGANGVAVKVGITLNQQKYVWTNRRRLSSQIPFEEGIEANEQGDLKSLKSVYAKCVEQRKLPLVLYYGTDRIIREVPQRGHIKNFAVTDALRNCFDNKDYFRDFYDWFKTEEDIELRELRNDKNYINNRLNSVRKAIEMMIRGYSNLRIELAPARMVLTNEQGEDLQIDQLSGGYKAVLSVVADIAKRLAVANPDSENPLEEEAVILIDELDLHLHPKWQKNIVSDLKRTFPNCQFIITTHSPFIIQSLEAEELYDISEMKYADESGNYQGWSIDIIQEQKMGVPKKTLCYNKLMERFSAAVDNEEYALSSQLYDSLVKMVHPNSHERILLDLDMEMIKVDDKA